MEGDAISSEQKDNPASAPAPAPAAATPLQAEVADRFGVLPNFFRLSPDSPEITANLWGFAQFGYLDNPLPSLFKERLFVYLSRFCKVRYCITRHVAFLVGLGRPSGDRHCPPETVEQAVRLIRRPLPQGDALEPALTLLNANEQPGAGFRAPASDTSAEHAIFVCATHVFLQSPDAARCLDALRRAFDDSSLKHLMVFLAFVRTAHFWTKVHPELAFEDDVEQLLATHEALAECVLNDPEAAASEMSQVLLDELNTLRQSSRHSRADLQRSNRALAESESFSRSVFESSPDCVKVLDPDGRLTRMNANGMCAMEIDDFAPFEGRSWCDLWPPEQRDDLRAALEVARGGGIGRYEGFCPTAKGTARWWDVTVSPIRSAEGNLAGFVSVSRDVTDRKRLEDDRDAQLINQQLLREQAETANVAKDNFIATLSHELRTPLTPVVAVLGAWERAPQFPEALREDLEMVRRNIDLEARLIDDLLDLTRIARGKFSLSLETLDVRKLLDSVVNMYRGEINAKQIDLVLAPQDERRHVLADPGRLQQAFWNLLKNAVKFSSEGGRVEVSTRIDVPGQIQIVVRDEGIGIAPEMLARLFTPFEQESVEAIRRYGGLGLGLSITRKLLEAQGGSIAAQSDGRYRGASFVITLPCVEAPDERLGNSTASCGNKERKQRCFRVLLVEDHVDTARVLARLMRGNGHEVATAHSVADAIRALTTAPFDLLVSDIGLPDGTGLDLIRQVRARHGLSVPAVALTGFGMEEDLIRCREAGFEAHLTKPINLVKLEETVQRVAAGAAGIDCA